MSEALIIKPVKKQPTMNIRTNVNLGEAFETFKNIYTQVKNSPTHTHVGAVFNLAKLKMASRLLIETCTDPDDLPEELFRGPNQVIKDFEGQIGASC